MPVIWQVLSIVVMLSLKQYTQLILRPSRPSPSHVTPHPLQASLSKQVAPQGEPPPILQEMGFLIKGKDLPLLSLKPRAKSQNLTLLASEASRTLVYIGHADS